MSGGRSLALSRNAFVQPPSEYKLLPREDRRDRAVADFRANHRRQANIFDAVAGRVSAAGFVARNPVGSRYRDSVSSSTVAVRPEEVLFRRQSAPERYEESDFYFANERLSSESVLPESDLLRAIHAYSADFYDHAITDGVAADDFRSMDETALIAIGILLEELAKESLGETGDLVLVEGTKDEVNLSEGEASELSQGDRSETRKRSSTKRNAGNVFSREELRSVRRKVSRRRKKAQADSSAPETTEGEADVEDV